MNWSKSVRPTTCKTKKFLVASLTLLLLLSLLGLSGGARRPARAQQDASLDVAITRIDHQHFPLVTVDVTVTDPDGSPVERLGSDNFRLFEDGEEDGEANEPVASASLVVEQNDAQPLDVILALDVHTSNERLAQIQAAAETFVDAVGERDEIALLTFHDQAQVVQRFTGNREILQMSLDGLTAQGTRSALDDAVTEAVALANEHGAARAVIVVVTDGDNGTSTPEQAIANARERAQETGVPVYVIGIGPRIATGHLSDLAQQTRAQFYAVQGTHEITDRLQAIIWLLRQGYQVRYWSDIQPDDDAHDLIVRVAAPQGVGEAQSYIKAQPNKVDVSLVGIVDGQPVLGTFRLSAEVSAPAPVKSVTYHLNGEILAERDEPPYTFTWDTTDLSPGNYTLTAQAVDREGNGGSTRISVQIPAPPSPPPPPRPAPVWQRYTMGLTLLIALGAATIITLTAFGAALAWQRVRYRQVCQVQVKNLGNTPSRYRLQTQEPSGALNFRFALIEPLPFAVQASAAVEKTGFQSDAPQPQAASRPRPKPQAVPQQRQEHPSSSISLHGAREKTNWLMSVSRAVAETIGAVGAILPRSMGQPLKNLSTWLRQQQTAASRVQKAPGEFVGRVQRIPKRMSRVQPSPAKRAASPSKPPPPPPSRDEIAPDTPSPPIERGIGRGPDQEREQASREERTRSQKPPIAILEQENGWTRTPSTPPGECLPLELIVKPVGRPTQTQTYPFKVTIQSIEQANAMPAEDKNTAPIKTVEGHIQVLEVSWPHHALPFFALAGLILIELALVALIVASTLSAFVPR